MTLLTTSSYGPSTKMVLPLAGALRFRTGAILLGRSAFWMTFLTLWQYSQLMPSHSVRGDQRAVFKSFDPTPNSG